MRGLSVCTRSCDSGHPRCKSPIWGFGRGLGNDDIVKWVIGKDLEMSQQLTKEGRILPNFQKPEEELEMQKLVVCEIET